MEAIRNTEDVEADILREVNYSREQLTTDLEALKDWLRAQKHLPETRMKESEGFLTNYLVGAKGSLATVKKKLDAYYSLRSVSPIFQDRNNVELIQRAYKTQFLLRFPQTLPDGCAVMMYSVRDPDINLIDAINSTRINFLAVEYSLRHFGIVRGTYVLVDATGFTSTHMLRTSPTILRSTITYVQEALSVRIKKYIIFNAPTYVENLMNTFAKPFMKEKLRERFIVTRESIEKVFDYPDCLPKEYGGKFPSVAELSAQMEKTVMNWSYLPNLDEKVDESLRPRKEGECNPYFGLHGSIKTLVID